MKAAQEEIVTKRLTTGPMWRMIDHANAVTASCGTVAVDRRSIGGLSAAAVAV